MPIYVRLPSEPETDQELKKHFELIEAEARKIDGFEKIESVDIEHGAGLLGISISYEWLAAGGLALLLLGDPINKNLDAWSKLFDRLSKIIQAIRNIGYEPIIDKDAGMAMAIKHIVDKGVRISSLRALSVITIGHVHGKVFQTIETEALREVDIENTEDAEWVRCQNARSAAHSCYLYLFEVNARNTVTIGVKKSGEVAFFGEMSPLD